jgi:hypothetical protein
MTKTKAQIQIRLKFFKTHCSCFSTALLDRRFGLLDAVNVGGGGNGDADMDSL